MRASSLSSVPFPTRIPARGAAVLIVVLGIAAVLYRWPGVTLATAAPAAIGIIAVSLIRRCLRRASERVHTILREELGHDVERRTAGK